MELHTIGGIDLGKTVFHLVGLNRTGEAAGGEEKALVEVLEEMHRKAAISRSCLRRRGQRHREGQTSLSRFR